MLREVRGPVDSKLRRPAQTETIPPNAIHKRGERAAEVLCLYAALVDK
jgi:hypothetical protein